MRFRHVVSGRRDFNLGGGCYRQVMESIKRPHKVQRKLPSDYDMMSRLYLAYRIEQSELPPRCEIARAILSVFFLLGIGNCDI